MKLVRLGNSFLFVGCMFGIGGCASPYPAQAPSPWQNLPPMRADTIARLLADGPNAYVNNVHVSTGAYVADGDNVSTGPHTSVKLILNRGGYIQLDENTDPLFKEGLCLLIKLVHGQALFSNVQCQRIETPNIAAVANSLVNVKTSKEETTVTVLEGHVDVESPSVARLDAYQQYTASAGTSQTMQLTPEQAVATAAWTQRYFRPPPTPEASSPSLFETAVIGGLIGVAIEVLRGGDHPSAPAVAPPPASVPAPTNAPPVLTQPESQTRQESNTPVDPSGWCCLPVNRTLERGSQSRCTAMGGVFSTDAEAARQACASRNTD